MTEFDGVVENINPRKIKSVKREETLKIVKFVNEGMCLAYDADSKPVFVRYVLPDELVRVNIYREHKDYAIAEPLEILEASAARIEPQCAYFSLCGGCDYQMLDYDTQLEVKKALAIDTFKSIGKMEDVEITDVIKSDPCYNYRNTETFKVGMRYKSIGFFRKDSRFVVDIEECKIAMNGINKALNAVRNGDYPKHNFKVRTTLDGDTVINWIKVDGYRDSEVYETVSAAGLSIKYKISKDSFFQVNDYVIPLWIEKIISFLDKNKNERIFDLYCGIGLITLFVGHFSSETIGVELSKSSIKDALHNLDINGGASNVKFIESAVEEVVDKLGRA
ncbi:MAG TPA: hypothetical protein P5322_10810, partial [Spirochaetota bacterium]|nr:hypothetical protein [Spirochaetota bacterium]